MTLTEIVSYVAAFAGGGGALAFVQLWRKRARALYDFASAELPHLKADYARLQGELSALKQRLGAE